MTTITTVFGLAPLVLFPGAGSELYRGLGSVLLGGLLVSTIFTLVLVPAMFSLAYQLFHWIRPDRVDDDQQAYGDFDQSNGRLRRAEEESEELSAASVS